MPEPKTPHEEIVLMRAEVGETKKLLVEIREYLPSTGKSTRRGRSTRATVLSEREPPWAKVLSFRLDTLEGRIDTINYRAEEIGAQIGWVARARSLMTYDDDPKAAQTHQSRSNNGKGDDQPAQRPAMPDPGPSGDTPMTDAQPVEGLVLDAATVDSEVVSAAEGEGDAAGDDQPTGLGNPGLDSQEEDILMSGAATPQTPQVHSAEAESDDSPAADGSSAQPPTAPRQEDTPMRDVEQPTATVTPEVGQDDIAESTSSNAGTADTGPSTPDASDPRSMVKLSPADMGDLLAALARNNDANTFLVPSVDMDLRKLRDNVNVDDLQSTTIGYKRGLKGKGYARVFSWKDEPDDRSDFDWSAFTKEIKRPTIEEARNIFENTIQNPPTDNIPYFIGHAPALDQYFDKPLNPGPAILGNPDLKDLHTQYHHISTSRSANRFHCEDMTSRDAISGLYHGFRSYNEVYFGPGYKLWLTIAIHHTAKFIDFIKENWACNECNQGIGHQSLLIAPSRLEKEGIEYRIDVIGCSEARETKPGELHAILNHGPSAARSMNYSLPGDKVETETLRYCEDCGLGPAYDKYSAKLVEPPQPVVSNRAPLVSGPPHKPSSLTVETRARTERKKELADEEDKAREADPLCNIPAVDRSDPPPLQVKVLMRAASIRSKVAMNQVVALTREFASRGSDVPEPQDSIEQRILDLKRRADKSDLAKFQLRYAQVCLAREVEKEKHDKGLSRISHKARAERFEMTDATINYHLQEGRKWIGICDPHEGLLPFILLNSKTNGFKITSKQWCDLKDDLLREFHILLDDSLTEGLNAAGKVFLGILDGSEKVAEWEPSLSNAAQAEDLTSALESYMMLTK
ncbi:Fc.00g082310.m01.CDS01 [Cosmosporella sp. VM-42]